MPPNTFIYRYTLVRLLGSDKLASLFLLEAGIDGIKYPANENRGFNYVVFNEKNIKIENVCEF